MTSRMNALRARKRAAGLVKVEVWVRPEHAAEVRELAKALTALVIPAARAKLEGLVATHEESPMKANDHAVDKGAGLRISLRNYS